MTYLTQLFSQWPEITTAPWLVPAVHSGVDRGKLETSRGAGISLLLGPAFLGEPSTSFGKESANSRTNEM